MNNNIETNEVETEGKVKFKIPDAQTLITIFYISVVVVGMIFNSAYYGIFEINIFDYSDILDFLVAPLGDLKILLFTVATLLLLILFYQFDNWVKIKYPKFYRKMYGGMNEKSWFNYIFYGQWLILIPLYLTGTALFYSIYQKKKILKSKDKIEIVFIDATKISGKKIGANSDFHFLLEGEDDVKVIPNSSIKSIVSKLKKKKDKN